MKPKLTKQERRAKYTALARDQQRKRIHGKTICFHCRKRGHAIADCPLQKKATTNACCYRCGSSEHALSACPDYKSTTTTASSSLPFATCFVCKEKGHLASTCPQNDKGIYVNGGACKVCGGKNHLSQHCPEKRKRKDPVGEDDDDDSSLAAVDNVTDLLEPETDKETISADRNQEKKKKRVVTF